jgi:NADH dehydrogenase
MHSIVIVGGGFAGATVARRLMGRLPDGWEVVLISEESYTTFSPLLAEVVGASVFPEHVVAPLRQVIATDRGGRFVMAKVAGIDIAHREICCDTLAGERVFAFDHLVLAFGNRARPDLVPGMADHALVLKTVGDALHIRNIVLRRLAAMELAADPAASATLGRFVVIGGGFSGVEVAGALADCLRGIRRYYRHIDAGALSVTVVHDGACLLPELPEKLGMAAAAALWQAGVTLLMKRSVTAIEGDCVILDGGERIATATVIATVGTRPNALIERLNLASERGRIVVGADFAVPDLDRVWAIGDCAWAINAATSGPSPPTAQFAIQQASLLAENLIAAVAGRSAKPFSYTPRGSMASVGHLKGVAAIFGVGLSGLPAWLLWRAFYLSRMPTFGRKLRIFVEWTWGMFFPADITHLRFNRSRDVDGE